MQRTAIYPHKVDGEPHVESAPLLHSLTKPVRSASDLVSALDATFIVDLVRNYDIDWSYIADTLVRKNMSTGTYG